jgi:ComF family protein
MLRALIQGVKELIYPKICLICKRRLNNIPSINGIICKHCWTEIKRNKPPFCHFCGRHLQKVNITKHICPACARQTLHFDRAFSPCIYEGIIKELIHEFKYKGKDYLGKTLVQPMIEFIKEFSLPMDVIDYIIPVPLSASRMREREFNQSEILASHIAAHFNKPMAPEMLARSRHTKTQTELEPQERLENVRGSFSLPRPLTTAGNAERIKNRTILLVDDVLTTAATASEAALTLKNAGAGVVFVLTLAN